MTRDESDTIEGEIRLEDLQESLTRKEDTLILTPSWWPNGVPVRVLAIEKKDDGSIEATGFAWYGDSAERGARVTIEPTGKSYLEVLP